jgi:uncharacterized radical SAM superfamily Fe-S cluster-containing enzyme
MTASHGAPDAQSETDATQTSHDQFGRKIEYLRISVTDRCNFRCQYCMPLEGLPWLPKADILRYEEITAIVQQLAPLGLRRLRITGGEPTIRPQLASLIRMLRDVPGVEDIALSTNGVKLPSMSRALAEAEPPLISTTSGKSVSVPWSAADFSSLFLLPSPTVMTRGPCAMNKSLM